MKEPLKNIVDLKTSHKIFKDPRFSYSVSGRWVEAKTDIEKYLRYYYIYVDMSQISSVFGSTTDASGFYGGRVYNPAQSLTPAHLKTLYQKEIGLALTLTNNFFSKELYIQNLPFLEKHHRAGNVIICTSDELAGLVRKDFPLYTLRASIIKNLNTTDKVKKALDLYTDVVIPMDMNDDDEFLESLPQKDRIMLFANAACAYNCPARICYTDISKVNQNQKREVRCSKQKSGLYEYAFYFFDVGKFYGMGFSKFKLVPARLFDTYLKTSPA